MCWGTLKLYLLWLLYYSAVKKMTTLQCQFFVTRVGCFALGSDPGVVQTEVPPGSFRLSMMARPSPSSSSVSRPCWACLSLDRPWTFLSLLKSNFHWSLGHYSLYTSQLFNWFALVAESNCDSLVSTVYRWPYIKTFRSQELCWDSIGGRVRWFP